MSSGDPTGNSLPSVIPREDVIFTDLDGLEGVLVDLKTKKFYRLNETAILIWRGLEKHLTVDMIVREVVELYEVTLDHARASVEALVQNLYTRKLVRPR